MEFWGTEVAPGKPQPTTPGDDIYCHVSQAALGPSKDGSKSERVVIRVESGGKNVVLGTLVSGKVDQMALDLIFDREFTLSHTSTSSSVFFCGYKTEKEGMYTSGDDSEEDEEDSDSDEPVPMAVPIKANGTAVVKEGIKAVKKQAKAIEQVIDAKVKKAESPKTSLIDNEALEDDESEEEDEDDDDEVTDATMHSKVKMDLDPDDYDEEEDSEFEVDDSGSEEDSDDLDEDDSDEDEDDSEEDEDEGEDDVAAELGKKRSLKGPVQKSPAVGKKARLDTPAKPGSQTAAEYWENLVIAGRKGLISTPAKKAKGVADAKVTPVSSAKKSDAKGSALKTPQKTPGKEVTVKTPKSTPPSGDSAKKTGAHLCADCNKNFNSDSALSQHAAAKHKK